VLEESGQTMHFFSEPYLRELLQEWSDLRLDRIGVTSWTAMSITTR
jgi:hypothetical protein